MYLDKIRVLTREFIYAEIYSDIASGQWLYLS